MLLDNEAVFMLLHGKKTLQFVVYNHNVILV